MKILLIGGPKFLGRALIDAALKAGHEITTFNRGKTNADLYPEIEKLHGNRDGELDPLKGRSWDAVVDTSGYLPRVVRQSAELLRDAVGVYVFVSSISVYAETFANMDETSPRAILTDPTVEQVTGETYGGLKALCEDAVYELYGDRALITRPGMIVGANDITYRFPYWVKRVARGGEVLYPADLSIQLVDAVDHSRFVLRALEGGIRGAYNVTGPDYKLTFLDTLQTIKDVSGSDATFTGAHDDFLLAQNIAPWSEFPFWLPSEPYWSQVNVDKAIAAGLAFRPLRDTVRDTLEWLNSHQPPSPFPTGITAEREAEILKAYHQQQ